MYFLLTKVLFQPYPLLFLTTGVALAWLWWRHKESRRRLLAVAVPLGTLAAVSTPVAVVPLLSVLEAPYPTLPRRPPAIGAIVVPGGGVREPSSVRPFAELTEDSLYRCLEAARLYHLGPPCPVVVTGGVLDPRLRIPPVARVMRDTLVDLGVAPGDVLLEPTARTTYENAVETRKLLDARGLRRVLVVTEALHMQRSMRTFRAVGLDATAAACRHRARRVRWELDWFIPSPHAASDFVAAWHEVLGLAWYRFKGWA